MFKLLRVISHEILRDGFMINPGLNFRFGELINEKVVEKGTFAKMARGELVRPSAQTSYHFTQDTLNSIFYYDMFI